MTQGRFETTMNLRPENWDSRIHWTNSAARTHAMPCATDHMYRESCPFHDLRAEGCFQPETSGSGEPGGAISPEKLVARPLARMKVADPGPSRYRGVGGGGVPIDTTFVPSVKLSRGRTDRPWGGKNVPRLFSSYPYMAEQSMIPKKPKKQLPPFACGRVPKKVTQEFVHMHDQPEKPRPPEPSRFKTGRLDLFDPYLRDTVPNGPLKPPMKNRNSSAPPPPRKQPESMLGTFGRYPQHIGEPHRDPDIRGVVSNRRPHIFTWWPHTKRGMPVSNRWETE
eukprot:PhM_4_TR13505/c0_g1_i1/m.66554